MALVPIPGFIAGSYNSRARGASATRSVNLRCEKNETANPKSEFIAYPVSGRKLFTTLPTSPINGSWSNRDRTFWAAGGVIYEVFQDGTWNVIGNVTIAGNPVTFRANGTQLLVCSAGNVYVATGFSFFRPIISYNTGTVNIVGSLVTWVSDPTSQGFAEVDPGDLFMIRSNTSTDGSVFIVQSVDKVANTLDLTTAPGDGIGIPFELGASYLTGVMPEFIDGYFIVNQPNSKTFWFSQIEDGTTWNALDFGTKSGSVDNIASIISFSGYLGLVGDTNSAEIWGDSGSANTPFARVSGQSLNVGTEAPWSVAKFSDGSVVWLMAAQGDGRQVVLTQGGAPVRISDHALEYAITTYGQIDDAIGATYIEAGHEFYRLDFPSANRTWEFDKTTGIWIELGVTTPQDEVYGCDEGRYRVHVTWPSNKPMNLAGDYLSGKIWQVSPQFYDNDGVDIPVMRIAPHINTSLERMNYAAFALDCELGTVNPALKGPDGKELIPMVSLSYSDDGANTWTDAGAASLGRVGEYQGTYLTPAESFDTTPGSQTNPQVWWASPTWYGLGSAWIAKTFKLKSNANALRVVYNGLTEVSK